MRYGVAACIGPAGHNRRGLNRLRATAAQLLRDSPAFRKLVEELSRPQ
jgi:hypothetical protein